MDGAFSAQPYPLWASMSDDDGMAYRVLAWERLEKLSGNQVLMAWLEDGRRIDCRCLAFRESAV